MEHAHAPEKFKSASGAALADRTLKIAIDRTTGTAERKRNIAVTAFPEFAAARDRGKRIKDHVIANLDHYLVEFERNAIASGAKVHWASTADEACEIVIRICRSVGAHSATCTPCTSGGSSASRTAAGQTAAPRSRIATTSA